MIADSLTKPKSAYNNIIVEAARLGVLIWEQSMFDKQGSLRGVSYDLRTTRTNVNPYFLTHSFTQETLLSQPVPHQANILPKTVKHTNSAMNAAENLPAKKRDL